MARASYEREETERRVNPDQFEQVDFRAILSEQVRQSGRLLFRAPK